MNYQREMKQKMMSMATTLKKNKKTGISLTKEGKDLYTENQKASVKETEGNTNKWKDIPCLWILAMKN